VGRTIRAVRRSRHRLRDDGRGTLVTRLPGRTITGLRRRGKFLLIDLDADLTLVSHLGMSGRWLFERRPPGEPLDHVHVVLTFADGTALRFQDPRRFGMARVVERARLENDRSLAGLGPDPVADPPTGPRLFALSRGARVSVKNFLLDQRRIAGIGNIYASEILHRAGVDPRRRAGIVRAHEWDAIAVETIRVLEEAIARAGTTFSMYRTVWGEPGGYGERLRVYDRAGMPCPNCGTPIRQIVQGARSTYYCPVCQPRSGRPRPTVGGGPETRPRASSGPGRTRKRHAKPAL